MYYVYPSTGGGGRGEAIKKYTVLKIIVIGKQVSAGIQGQWIITKATVASNMVCFEYNHRSIAFADYITAIYRYTGSRMD